MLTQPIIQFTKAGVVVTGSGVQNLGTLTWTPPNYNTFLWQAGPPIVVPL